jgi:hypothetical protein
LSDAIVGLSPSGDFARCQALLQNRAHRRGDAARQREFWRFRQNSSAAPKPPRELIKRKGIRGQSSHVWDETRILRDGDQAMGMPFGWLAKSRATSRSCKIARTAEAVFTPDFRSESASRSCKLAKGSRRANTIAIVTATFFTRDFASEITSRERTAAAMLPIVATVATASSGDFARTQALSQNPPHRSGAIRL